MLYLVPTPIGNLGDMTYRAVEVLKTVDIVYAEDTRRTLQLFNHFEIYTKLRSYHEHNKESAGEKILGELRSGASIALVSDAGMPCISDPGLELVELCIAENLDFTVLPGATAFATAFVGSGLGRNEFHFVGFLPKSGKNRRKKLEESKRREGVHIFYESPHALRETLADMLSVLGDRKAVIARELTKIYEEYIRGGLGYLVEHFSECEPRGEFVVLVEGAPAETPPCAEEGASLEKLVTERMSAGMSARDAAETLAAELGLRKKIVYDAALRAKK